MPMSHQANPFADLEAAARRARDFLAEENQKHEAVAKELAVAKKKLEEYEGAARTHTEAGTPLTTDDEQQDESNG